MKESTHSKVYKSIYNNLIKIINKDSNYSIDFALDFSSFLKRNLWLIIFIFQIMTKLVFKKNNHK